MQDIQAVRTVVKTAMPMSLAWLLTYGEVSGTEGVSDPFCHSCVPQCLSLFSLQYLPIVASIDGFRKVGATWGEHGTNSFVLLLFLLLLLALCPRRPPESEW